MKVRIVNVEYYEWEIPEELVSISKTATARELQNLIDEYFCPDDLSSAQEGDTYYEFKETIEE